MYPYWCLRLGRWILTKQHDGLMVARASHSLTPIPTPITQP
ncbi:MAG: hypothetical protein AVDCRST_MAG93-3657 [uncultured Chloroflexia bacterium]|uniref:Uncharacterized protein n=1 Tax=uncultured Chloroflexia bacterium TaxID=1672391 RepID=A0A6J4JUA2_9CHLR|nr:MAG: hypothetical protein AVDCRST_MAG93-3657 [uncultured Chloroflexia bacterium]